MTDTAARQRREVRMRSLRAVQLLTIVVFFFGLVLPVVAQEKGAEGAYTIKQGDTLWDISSRFLKNPFLWPKLWQRNSYITNPHWIYPGNPIRLSAFEEIRKEEPAKVAADERVIGEKPEVEKIKEEKPKGVAPVAFEPEVKREEPPPVEKKPELV